MRHTVHYVFGKTVHSISSLQGSANRTERRKTSEAIILAFTNSHFWYLVRGRVFVRVRVGNSKIANRPSPSPSHLRRKQLSHLLPISPTPFLSIPRGHFRRRAEEGRRDSPISLQHNSRIIDHVLTPSCIFLLKVSSIGEFLP